MASVPENFLITAAPPTGVTTNALIVVYFFTLGASAEKTYLEAVESGIFKSDVDMAAMLTRLQFKVSTIREDCLRSSLSYRAALCGFFKGDSIKALQCLREVLAFDAHIEILKEDHLCTSDATSESATRVLSLRQRQTIAGVESSVRVEVCVNRRCSARICSRIAASVLI
ncbi:hypothetical protein FB451DRAFT_1194298 [Mycena latifolia]|nr:hypothetical protein FB451DRAFT_1194298 [Mycena latifolia]